MTERNDTRRFTMRDDEAEPDSIYTSDAENLRIKKLSSRITTVAVLIPCLLAIVLVVVYLDLKNRVANTHSTGSLGVQNLSKDLESRFSNLSLKMAKMEDQLKGHAKTVEKTTAALQVNLKKATTDLKRLSDGKPDKKALSGSPTRRPWRNSPRTRNPPSIHCKKMSPISMPLWQNLTRNWHPKSCSWPNG